MRKIPTVFVRNSDDRRYVTDEVNPGCEWVLAGEGTPTRKYDGTCVMLDGFGQWWARREVKPGKTSPAGFQQEQHDEVTGKIVGWEPVAQSPFAKFHAEAIGDTLPGYYLPGTYELIGPKINGNPEGEQKHRLVPHSEAETPDSLFDASIGSNTPPKTLVRFVARKYGWEGIVWHHPDGRMAKLKYRDFPRDNSDGEKQ